jgi:hypothetical protein
MAFWLPVLIILCGGAALSVAAYLQPDNNLTVIESVGAGFVGVAALVVGLFAAFFGLVIGGGAAAFALFLVASPAIALILLILLMRSESRRRAAERRAAEAAI